MWGDDPSITIFRLRSARSDRYHQTEEIKVYPWTFKGEIYETAAFRCKGSRITWLGWTGSKCYWELADPKSYKKMEKWLE